MSKYKVYRLVQWSRRPVVWIEKVGFDVPLAIEKDAWAVDTYKANHVNQNIVEADITKLEDEYFMPYKGTRYLRVEDLLVRVFLLRLVIEEKKMTPETLCTSIS